MYKHILESAQDIDWMAIIPLMIFFVFFTVMFIKVMREEKSFIKRMASLPLEEDNNSHASKK